MFSLQTSAEVAPQGGTGAESGRPTSYDPSTGIPDARALRRALEQHSMQALRTGDPLTLVLLGLSEPPSMHALPVDGELEPLLVASVRRFQASFRAADVLGRWNDGVFAVLLPRTPLLGGVRAVQKAFRGVHPLVAPPLVARHDLGFAAAVVSVRPGAPIIDGFEQGIRLLDLARERGMGFICWPEGEMNALEINVLLISEDSTIVTAMDDELRSYQATVLQLADPDLAVHTAEATLPGLIILDLDPTEDAGKEVLTQLRTNTVLRGIPVATLSSKPEALGRALAAGANDGVRRPYTRQELQRCIAHLLRPQLPSGALNTARSKD